MIVNATPTFMDRILAAIREIIRGELPQLTYSGIWEYQITDSYDSSDSNGNSARLYDGTPTSDIPLPDIVGIALRPGIPGMIIEPAAGSTMLVGFINSDPTRPYVIAWDGATPDNVKVDVSSNIELGGSGATYVALAQLVFIQLNSILATLTPMVTAFNSAMSGQPVISGGSGSVPVYSPLPVAASKVKAS